MTFDHKNPNYHEIFLERAERLERIRARPEVIPAMKLHYRENPVDFINDWGCTFDPRNIEVGLPSIIPFILFERQIEWIEWVLEKWRNREPGVSPKSREVGVSWLLMSLSCGMSLHNDGFSIGIGSRKEEYVDKLGDMKSLFAKGRMFMRLLPTEFRGGWNEGTDAPHMLMKFPQSGSTIAGEAGANIGRGNRTSIYFVDEAGFLERPELVDAALSNTTNCRIDVSSANGMANPFAQKVHAESYIRKNRVFVLHWRDDPRKDEAWYAKKVEELNNPVIVAQELDINYSASAEGVLIPSDWVAASIDAHVKLGFEPSGSHSAALDVADEGQDTLSWCAAHGVIVTDLVEWSGKGGDLHRSTEKAFGLCHQADIDDLIYDADGLGAGVRGAARVLNEVRRASGLNHISITAFRGSAAVERPDAQDVKGRKNKDFFANCKAQSWWALRMRFYNTYLAVVEGREDIDLDDIISIPSSLKLKTKLMLELVQPTYSQTNAGRIQVDKTPDGAKSPNLADSLMIRFNRNRKPMSISQEAIVRAVAPRPLVAHAARRGLGISAAALQRFGARGR